MPAIMKENVDATLRAGAESFGGWEKCTGGRLTTEVGEHRPPGAEFRSKSAGAKNYTDMTLEKTYDSDVDGAYRDRLKALAGTQTMFTVGVLIRDGSRNVVRVETRVGILTEVGELEGDTMGGTDKVKYELVLAING